MSDDRKAVKKIKRKNPHLRLVKNDIVDIAFHMDRRDRIVGDDIDIADEQKKQDEKQGAGYDQRALDRKAVKKIKRKNPHLRLVKNDDGKSKGGSGRQDKLRFDRTKRTLIIAGGIPAVFSVEASTTIPSLSKYIYWPR